MERRNVASPATANSTADYRRQARKIRAAFSTQPLLRHHALSSLARQTDAARQPVLQDRVWRTTGRQTPPQSARYLPAERGSASSAVERGFADHAADRLRNPVFTFSDRTRLLNMGEKLGIPRFRANLILALEQHRLEPIPNKASSTRTNSGQIVSQLLAIVMVEAVVVAMCAWACTW